MEQELGQRLERLAEEVNLVSSQIRDFDTASLTLNRVASDYGRPEFRQRGPGQRLSYSKLLRNHADILEIGYQGGTTRFVVRKGGINECGPENGASAIFAGEKRVDVSESDLFRRLENFADSSVGAVLGIDVLGRLPLQRQRELVGLCFKKLRPTGVFISDTTGPECFYALVRAFYLDANLPRPIPQELLRALLSAGQITSSQTQPLWSEEYTILEQITSADCSIAAGSGVKLMEDANYAMYGYIGHSTMICRKLLRPESRQDAT